MRTLYAALFLAALLYALNYLAQRTVWAWVVLMTYVTGGGT